MTWKAVSEAFGKTILEPTNKITMNLRFPGQYYDQETGTHYNYFRDYNPNIGRYNESDPIGLFGGINPYGYGYANPLAFYDPYGLWSFSDAYFGMVNKILPDVVTDFITNDTVVNSAAGFGDSLSLGLTKLGRDSFDIGSVDYCSSAYKTGDIAGTAWGLGLGGAGVVKSLGTGIKGVTTVSRWGGTSNILKPGRWVMEGGQTRMNYLFSFKWDFISKSNVVRPFSAGQTFINIPSSALRYPSGWGIDGMWKGFVFGQKVYNPGVAGLPAWVYDASKYGMMGGAQAKSLLNKDCGCK